MLSAADYHDELYVTLSLSKGKTVKQSIVQNKIISNAEANS
jgi:hypothetical protein